jgi:hypothetical protein
MKVVFYCSRNESDEYEFPDNISDAELQGAADQWVSDNVCGRYEIIDDDE